MASRQQHHRVVGTGTLPTARIEAFSNEDNLSHINHYSVIGLRTWGQNYYDVVVKNSQAAAARLQVDPATTATPSPQKKPEQLRVAIPCSDQDARDPQDSMQMVSVSDQVYKTPVTHTSKETEVSELPSTVSKHLHGMFDDIMKEVFLNEEKEGDVNRAQETMNDADGFRIAACPSPTRGVLSFRQPPVEGQDSSRNDIVLNMEDMSPLLERMREIDRARNKNIALPSSSHPSPTLDEETIDLEIQQGTRHGSELTSNHVPSLVNFFDSRSSRTKNNLKIKEGGHLLPTSAKPPLPSPRGALEYLGRFKIDSRYAKKMDQLLAMMHRTTRGRRVIFTMIALAYLVAIHVYLITSKL